MKIPKIGAKKPQPSGSLPVAEMSGTIRIETDDEAKAYRFLEKFKADNPEATITLWSYGYPDYRGVVWGSYTKRLSISWTLDIREALT